MAGIVSSPLSAQSVASEIQAPGEVKFNAYRSAKVNPRISAQIISREAKLGDGVKKDQSLIILSSIEMAQAQGELIVSSKEWARVNELGAKVVSDRRFIEAKVAFNQSKAKVTAYGMTENQISDFLNTKHNPQPDGVFRLLAPIAGTIIRDDFILGELIEPGRVLFEISDESSIWVEAQVSPEDGKKIAVGSLARVKSGNTIISGRVIQVQHLLDETTRTLGVRVEVPNDADSLHPGTFVDVLISGRDHVNVLALPKEAVLRNPDGDFVIFLEMKPGEFHAKEIKVVRSEGDLVIIDGIDAGQSVVVKGAFFVQSEFAKSAFQAHNH
ncbi:MAG: efflux RND transporter periplasmic adaptor subunit [Magnetococcales bacterium]|nr:efflux RND transporter periplasmic adaptor subunit [Magnetococcales bacterium]MBF0116959.1 efflux RND transporter periplasmic adaptor subunit [Magnetococcales bacterium]